MADKKEIQEQRIRKYFMDAAKETLKGEGLRAVNVRAIAERAGYSYATLYNYFKDLNELIFLCVQDFTTECETFVNEETIQLPAGKERLKARVQAYVDYFIQYPGIFELIFLESMRNLGNKEVIAQHIYTFMDHLCQADLDVLKAEGKLNDIEAANMLAILKNATTGLLLFYNNRMQPSNYKTFMEISLKQIDTMVKSI